MPLFRVSDYHISPNDTNIIKGFAICFMLCHHLFLGHGDFGLFFNQIALIGKTCVALFVFVSGYGMAIQFEQLEQNNVHGHRFSKVVKFLFRRLFKFYTHYWFIFIIAVPIGVFVFGQALSSSYGTEANIYWGLILDLFGMQGFGSYNITWWFNRIIIVSWGMFPLFYWSMKSRVVSAWVLLLFFLNPGDVLWPFHSLAYGLPFYMIDYALGIFIALHIKQISYYLKFINPYIILALSLAATLFFLCSRNIELIPCFGEYLADPFIAISLSLSVVSFCRLFNSNLTSFAFLGKHSMNIYLTHTFIFLYFFQDFTYSLKNPLLIFLFVLLTSLGVSYLFELLKKRLGFYKAQKRITFLFEQE